MNGMYHARARLDLWLVDKGKSTGPVEFDAHNDDGVVVVYASVVGGGTCATFVLPPGYPYDALSIEQFFATGKKTFSEELH